MINYFFLNRNFIPGHFLDTDGNVKIAPPPPVKDRLEEIIQQFGNRSQEVWLLAGLVLATVVSMILNSLFFAVSYFKKIPLNIFLSFIYFFFQWAFAKILHLDNETKFKIESIPGSIDAKNGVAKRLLEVYDNQPASFKNAKLNLEPDPDLEDKSAVKKSQERPLPKTRAKKPQRSKKKKKNKQT